MENFTDALIEDYSEIKSNYLDLHLPIEDLINTVKSWNYYEQPNPNYKKLSRTDWENTKSLFLKTIELGGLQINPQAEIVINKDAFYIILVHFRAYDGNWYYIDGLLNKKNKKGISNGTRKIDSRCPTVDEVKNALETNSRDIELYKKVFEIVATRPDLIASTPEKKIQYKINGTIGEHIIEQAMDELNIPYEIRDEYNEFFYKGSPGNICDWLVTINNTIYKLDGKVVDNSLTSAEKSAHDAAALLGIVWRTKKAEAKAITSAANSLLELPLFKELLDRVTKIYSSLNKPLIGIKSINLETGEADIYHFG